MQWRRIAVRVTFVALAGLAWLPRTDAADFIRGDSNASGIHSLADAIHTLQFLFLGTVAVTCEDAADTDDNGILNINDPIFSLQFVVLGLHTIAPPIDCGADPTADNATCESFAVCVPTGLTERQRIGHLLNRIAYGPTISDVEAVMNLGISGYIQQQLDPASIAEDPDLIADLAALTESRQPAIDTALVRDGLTWRYMKGTQQPPTDWKQVGFDDSGWTVGVAPIGYDTNNNYPLVTNLEDMNDPVTGYLTVFLRQTFQVADPSTIDSLILQVSYDDGFWVHLNGTVVESVNVNSTLFSAPATGNHESDGLEDFDISQFKSLLVPGDNVIAVQLHNRATDSSDAIIDVGLVSRVDLPGDPIVEYPSFQALKASVHLRGIYSTRRLQVVLADFWENHFTTDVEKIAAYFQELTDSDGTISMTEGQARREAATLEAAEYEFFLENALGNFGDLLRFSAKSPTMLIYLDNILNFKSNPNENYSREILELHSYGVDNGYVQRDIEEGARVFTGWNVCKVAREDVGDPHADCGPQFNDTVIMDLGSIKYFKGTQNPTEIGIGMPTTEWTGIDYDDTGWFNGATGIGYGDGDDTTVLGDMRNLYRSVFVRQRFTLTGDPDELKSILLSVNYDDGFVGYLNGVEIARSESMFETGSPPNYDVLSQGREIEEGVEVFNLNEFRGLLVQGTNVFAAQVHNVSLGSSDLSFLPRLVDREILPESVENSSLNGAWSFRFLEQEHDYNQKLLFSGRAYQLPIPARPENNPQLGLLDGDEFIDQLVDSAPTAEFICTKLVKKLVDDSAPPDIVARAIGAWNSTTPKGNIATVVEEILLNPSEPASSNPFFDGAYYRSKVKDPLEFVNSSARALEAATEGFELLVPMELMGMHIFTRDEPDGWPESGVDWSTAGGILNRILLAQDLSSNDLDSSLWQTQIFLNDNGIATAAEIVDFFNDLLFEGTLTSEQEAMLVEYVETNDFYNAQPLVPGLADYTSRIQSLVSLMLSLPQWNFQ